MSFLSDLLGNKYHEGMSEQDISSALENLKVTAGEDKLKAAVSKANSEAANYKKQMQSYKDQLAQKMTAEEAEKVARDEERQRILDENAQLKQSMAISEKTAQLLNLGYGNELAASTATAMITGDLETVIANQTKFIEEHDKNVKATQMKNTPKPVVGNGSAGTDYASKIADARSRGSNAEVAYYTRLQQMEAVND